MNPLGVYDSSTALWLQGKGQQDQQKEDAHTEESTALLGGRTEDFNRRLREQPADTQLWIEFIRYQVHTLLYNTAAGMSGLQNVLSFNKSLRTPDVCSPLMRTSQEAVIKCIKTVEMFFFLTDSILLSDI